MFTSNSGLFLVLVVVMMATTYSTYICTCVCVFCYAFTCHKYMLSVFMLEVHVHMPFTHCVAYKCMLFAYFLWWSDKAHSFIFSLQKTINTKALRNEGTLYYHLSKCTSSRIQNISFSSPNFSLLSILESNPRPCVCYTRALPLRCISKIIFFGFVSHCLASA